MKKIYILCFLVWVILFPGKSYSQLDAPHAVLHFTGPDTMSAELNVTIQNVSTTQSFDVVIRRTQKVMAPGHQTYFCWRNCYDTSVVVSPDVFAIAPGASSADFHGWVAPVLTPGMDTVYYDIYDMNGISDTLRLQLTYDFTTTGINELNEQSFFISSSPNPADGISCITYKHSNTKGARIVITNVLGSLIKEIKLNDKQGAIILNTSEMYSGIYFYSLVVDGKTVASKKLVVAHK